nr:MAG TPA: hypothetical protein [Caudoviricetes sp.]
MKLRTSLRGCRPTTLHTNAIMECKNKCIKIQFLKI